MADYSISVERGLQGFENDDFVVGTQSPNAGSVELRIEDDDGLNRIEVIEILKAMIRWFEDPMNTTYPKL